MEQQDKNLDDLLSRYDEKEKAVQGEPAKDPESAPSPTLELDPEVYREIGVLGSHAIAGGIRLVALPFGRDFAPLRADQVDKVQPSTSKLIKKLFDWAWPQLLEKHGQETIAAMAWGSVILENLHMREPVTAEKAEDKDRKQLRGIVLPGGLNDGPMASKAEV